MSYEHIKRRIVEHNDMYYAIDYRIWDEKNNTYKIIENDAEAKRGVANNLVETIHVFETKDQADRYDERQNKSPQGANDALQFYWKQLEESPEYDTYTRKMVKNARLGGRPPVVLSDQTTDRFTGDRKKYHDISIFDAVNKGATVSVTDKDDRGPTIGKAIGAQKHTFFEDEGVPISNIENYVGGMLGYSSSGYGKLNPETMQYKYNVGDPLYDSTAANVFSFLKEMMFNNKSHNIFYARNTRYDGYAEKEEGKSYENLVDSYLEDAHNLIHKNKEHVPEFEKGTTPNTLENIRLHLVAQILLENDYRAKGDPNKIARDFNSDATYKRDVEINVLKSLPFLTDILEQTEKWIMTNEGYERGYADVAIANPQDRGALLDTINKALDIEFKDNYKPINTGFIPKHVREVYKNLPPVHATKAKKKMESNIPEHTDVNAVLKNARERTNKRTRPTNMHGRVADVQVDNSGIVPEPGPPPKDVRPNLFNKFMESVGKMGVGKR